MGGIGEKKKKKKREREKVRTKKRKEKGARWKEGERAKREAIKLSLDLFQA